jgi:hypothetical protein
MVYDSHLPGPWTSLRLTRILMSRAGFDSSSSGRRGIRRDTQWLAAPWLAGSLRSESPAGRSTIQVPRFPTRSPMLHLQGFATGPRLGAESQGRATTWWIKAPTPWLLFKFYPRFSSLARESSCHHPSPATVSDRLGPWPWPWLRVGQGCIWNLALYDIIYDIRLGR